MKVAGVLALLLASAYANRIPSRSLKLGDVKLVGKINNNLGEEVTIDILPPELVEKISAFAKLDDPEISTRNIVANVNEYADKIFANVKTLIIHAGLDPLQMPDLEAGFSYTLLFITYHGELTLTKGWLQDISTLHRGGDVVVDYDTQNKYLDIIVPINFDDMQFSYDYDAKIMDLGPTGGVEGKIANLAINVVLGFDANTLVASLDEFTIVNSGHIDVAFTGNSLIDWLLDILSELVTTLLKGVILDIAESIVKGGLQAIVDAVNNFIQGIINPTSTTAAPAVIKSLKFLTV